MAVKKGTLIKWVSSHKSYEANGDVLVGLEPIYKYGIIMEVSRKNKQQKKSGSGNTTSRKSSQLPLNGTQNHNSKSTGTSGHTRKKKKSQR